MILKLKYMSKTIELDSKEPPDAIYFEALAIGFQKLLDDGKVMLDYEKAKVIFE